MMNAPVLLITFNRPEHTRRTLEALLAQHPAEIFVFRDGPRDGNEKDIVDCEKVRSTVEELAKTSNCKFHYNWSDKNRGCRDAVIFAISSVLNEHEVVIVVEDDIVTSPAFLEYMNKALDFYKDRKSVFSISGHSHTSEKFQIRHDYPYDVYASPRLFNWGWGTWRDRWVQCDWTMSYYQDLMEHPEEVKAFCRGGDDMIRMLTTEKNGMSSAWDIQFAFCHFMNHGISIVPCKSYTYNIGEDGSGTHCSNVGKAMEGDCLERLNQNANPRFLTNLYFDRDIINSQYNVFCAKKRPLWKKIINRISRICGITPPFVLKGKVFE